MGLASFLLGEENPLAQWMNQNHNMLSTIGTGLMQGQNIQHGLQIAGQYLPQAEQLDIQQAEKLKAEALKKAQVTATLGWLKNDPKTEQVAWALEQGLIDPGQAFTKGLELKNGKAAAPDIQTFFDKNGLEYKGYYDPNNPAADQYGVVAVSAPKAGDGSGAGKVPGPFADPNQNILLQGTKNAGVGVVNRGDPRFASDALSPTSPEYWAAYNNGLGEKTESKDGVLTTTRNDMSAFAPPVMPGQPGYTLQAPTLTSAAFNPQLTELAVPQFEKPSMAQIGSFAPANSPFEMTGRQAPTTRVVQPDPNVEQIRPPTDAEKTLFNIPLNDNRPRIWKRGEGPKLLDPAGQNITVNNGPNSSKFADKSDELAAARLDTIVQDANKASYLSADLQTLAEIGKSLNTGKGAEIMLQLAPYAEVVGFKIDGLGEAQAYQAIVDRLAPNMRPPGGGASSDYDAKQFLRSLPQLGNSETGNTLITATFQAIQDTKIAAGQIARRAQNGEITWQEAEDQISKLPNPFDAFKKFVKENPDALKPVDTSSAPPAQNGNGERKTSIGVTWSVGP